MNNTFTNNFGFPIVLKHYGCGKTHNQENVVKNLTVKCQIHNNKSHGFSLKHLCDPNTIHLQ